MITKEAVINNQVGLHARPATFFIQKANEFKSSIWIEKDERRVNAKSLLGVLSLGIVKGTTVTLVADGADEQEAFITKTSRLVDLICQRMFENVCQSAMIVSLVFAMCSVEASMVSKETRPKMPASSRRVSSISVAKGVA